MTDDFSTCLFGGADLENLGAAFRAGALNSGLAVLHRDFLRVFNLTLLFALDTITLHCFSSKNDFCG
jgi:hypothetical protein